MSIMSPEVVFGVARVFSGRADMRRVLAAVRGNRDVCSTDD